MPRASLAERKDNRYRCKYKGKEFYGKSQTEALKKREAYIDLIKQGLRTNASEMTVREYSGKWLPTHRSDVKKRTYNTYASYLDIANDYIGDMTMLDVSPSDIRTALNHYNGKSQSSIDKMYILLHSMFESAFRDGFIRCNPCDDAEKPTGTSGSHRALTTLEDSLILTVDHPLRLAVLFMRYGGLRRGEVLALDSDDIDTKNDIIHITKAISFDGNKPIEGLPKTECGIRDVPLFTRLKTQINGFKGRVVGKEMSETSFTRAWESYINAVEKHLNGCQKRWYGRRREDKEKNPARYNRIIELEKEAKRLEMYGKDRKAKEKRAEAEALRLSNWQSFSIRPHDLRHSYVTMLCDANVEKDLAMKWVGHADINTTLKIYAKVKDKEAKQEILNGMNNIIQPKKYEEK